jgi:hypothetical protein
MNRFDFHSARWVGHSMKEACAGEITNAEVIVIPRSRDMTPPERLNEAMEYFFERQA